MNRCTINLSIVLALGLGIATTLLLLLNGGRLDAHIPNVYAADLVRSEPAQAPAVSQGILQANAPITRYVASTGTNAGDCAAPSGACRTIQYAVDAASAGDLIKVAAGNYTGVQSRPAPAGYDGPVTISQLVYINKTITIRGGYSASNDFADPPDPRTNQTTLDAQGQGRVIFISGATSPRIEGLRITGGDATNQGGIVHPNFTQAGGGVCVIGATPTISNNEVFENTAGGDGAGGGLFLLESSATLQHNTITSNTAVGWYGGGMYLFDSPITFISNTVSANFAQWGGAVFLEESPATFIGNIFSANTASSLLDFGGAGGALNVHSSAATISDNTFTFNKAIYGGGMRLYNSAATLNDNIISNNSASDYGGGLHLWLSSARLNGNVISNNSATNDGGGLEIWSDNISRLNGNRIVSNRTLAGNGGGLHLAQICAAILTNNVIADNQAADSGSGLYIEGTSRPILRYNTIANNAGGDVSGVYVTDNSTADLSNTLLVNHDRGIIVDQGSEATLEATLWANGNDWSGSGAINVGSVNIWGDPDFVGGDYHIDGHSAAIGAGVDTGVDVDIDGEHRPAGLGYDIGADEYYGPALAITKSANPSEVRPGEQLTYTISVTNLGTVALDATIADLLPMHVMPGVEPGGTTLLLQGKTITWTGITIAISDVWTHSFTVTVEASYAMPLVNVVQATTSKGASGIYTQTSIVIAPPSVPTLLAPLNAATTTPGAINFTWTAGAGLAPDGYNFMLDGAVITTTETSSSNILPTGDYTWTVRAYNTEGYSAWATAWKVTVAQYHVYLPLLLNIQP